MAPEILRKGPYGKPADVWALGVILFILLAGGYPFSDPSLKVLFRRISLGEFAFDRAQWVSNTHAPHTSLIALHATGERERRG